MTVDYGRRLRLGILIPSGNTVAEPQINTMLPAGVAAHYTRLRLTGSSDAELEAMLAGLDTAVQLLADARPDLLVFHCTAVTTASAGAGTEIAERMRRLTGIPSIATSHALESAFAALGTSKLVLLSPYVPAVHAREIEYLRATGLEVVAEDSLGINTNTEMAALPPEQLYDFAVRNRDPAAEAYFLSCTALRSAEVIEDLEAELGRPVVTSNQAMVWHALRTGDIPDRVPGFGELLRS
ncbi:maleate cis-trans isomerase family protein [Streptomyces sp. NPDC000880]